MNPIFCQPVEYSYFASENFEVVSYSFLGSRHPLVKINYQGIIGGSAYDLSGSLHLGYLTCIPE